MVLCMLRSGSVYSKVSIQCVGNNTPNVTFTIEKNKILLSDGFVFDLEGATPTTATGYKNYYKRNLFGIKKIDSSWDILINFTDGTASITTYRDYKGGVAQDIYRRYYSKCR